jgi:hypothetical protein
MKQFYTLVVSSLLLAAFPAAAMTVESPTCEHLENPLGVDVLQPRLTWTLESPQRGDRQTAYQILAASSRAMLEKDTGDLWDSGKVISDDTIQIPFAGKPLKSSQQVFWKVRVWDANGKVSKWSPLATWTMGILDESAWSAHWISAEGAEKCAVFYPAAVRRDFNNRQAFAKANPDAGKPWTRTIPPCWPAEYLRRKRDCSARSCMSAAWDNTNFR